MSEQPQQQQQQLILPPISAQSRAFAIPEVLKSLETFLDRHSIVMCLRVSHVWYKTFLPRVWATIWMKLALGYQGTHSANLDKHAPLVDTLSLVAGHLYKKQFTSSTIDSVNSPSQQPLTFPSLSTLSIFLQDRNEVFKNEDSLVAFVKRHRSLVKAFTVQGGMFTPWKLLDAISDCTALQELYIWRLNFQSPEQWVNRYESFWSQLRVLHLRGRWFSGGLVTPEMMERLSKGSETKIQELEMHVEQVQGSERQQILEVQSLLILKSPELTRLAWQIGSEKLNPMALLAKRVSASGRCFYRLESLSLPLTTFDNTDFKVLVESMPALAELQLDSTSFHLGSWNVLCKTTPNLLIQLTRLNVRNCIEVTGATIHDALCTLPNLKSLDADYITDADITRDDRPWICKRLNRLCLAFVLLDRANTQPRILTRLLQLEALEQLDMRTLSLNLHIHQLQIQPVEFSNHCLRLNLSQGLDQLKTLTKLQVIQGPKSMDAQWKEEEARWTLRHWSRLIELGGFDVNFEAFELLRLRVAFLQHFDY